MGFRLSHLSFIGPTCFRVPRLPHSSRTSLCRQRDTRRYLHHSTPPIGGIASASEAGFRILGEETLYSRYKRITERRVGFPDGKEVSFDVLGKPNSRSVFVFPLSPDGKTVTMLREYAPGPHQIMYGFPAGFVEDQVVNRTGAQMGDLSVNRDLEENQVVGGPVGSPNGISDISKRVGPKHSSLEDAALAELSEEARLVCDELVPLSGKQGIMADKYSQGSFHYFLGRSCRPDPAPGPLDTEEWIEIVPDVPLSALDGMIRAGLMNTPNSLLASMSLSYLASKRLT